MSPAPFSGLATSLPDARRRLPRRASRQRGVPGVPAPDRPRYARESMEPTRLPRVPDVQASPPVIPVSLSRVGVTNVEKVTRIGPRGAEQLYHAKLDCFVDLGPRQRGAHMSRFEEVVNDVIGSVVPGVAGF